MDDPASSILLFLQNTESVASITLTEVILDILWTMGSQAKRIDGRAFDNTGAREAWYLYVDGFFASSPILVSFLTKRADWYGDER